LVNRLLPAAAAGVPIVGLEPSCTAVLATDLVELLPGDEDAAVVAGATTTLARMLLAAADDGWQPPSLAGLQVLAQPHCHQHATFGFDADRRLLELAGAELTTIAGCCGMAGNFGMEAGHYEVSRTVAENGFLAALAAASARTVVLADGFSCRTQIADLAGRTAAPLAVLLASRLRARSGG
jgi:Fe-S oxidoreductase